MNKVFKVIWNEAKNCYVVVSELAKNRGGKSCSTRKLLAMLIATGVMCCAPLMNVAEAAQPSVSGTDRAQYVSFLVSIGNNCTQEECDSGTKTFGSYTYRISTIDGNKYWVRDGYNLIIDPDGGKYTELSKNTIRADVVRTGDEGSANGLLRSVTSAIGGTDVKTNLGETLQRVDAGTYAAVSLSGGTGVLSNYNYIIYDPERQGTVANGGYFDAGVGNLADNFVVAGASGSGLTWNEDLKQYEYNNGKTTETVDYSNMYVIEFNENGQSVKKLGVFVDSKENLYKGTVYGLHNEILMTVKDGDNIYSYWAAKVTDPTQTMATFPVVEYQKNLDTLVSNDKALYHNDIKEVTLEKEVVGGVAKNDSGEIKLWRNGFTLNEDGTTSANTVVDGTIKISGGGGTGGSGAEHDTFVKVGIGSDELKLNTGSKVEAVGTTDATTGIKINGETYNIKTGSDVSVSQEGNKNTTINVNGTDYTITDTDTHNKLQSAKLTGKTLTITGQDQDTVSVDLSDITSGLSTTDYALVVNPADGSEGKYKADANGNLKLKVKDRNGTDTYDVVIEDVASAEKVAENTTKISTNTTNITNLKNGLFKVSDGTKTATIKHEDTVKIVGTGAASVAVDETNKTVTINATDTTYASGTNITIDEKNGNKINLNSALLDITSIENGTASISLTNNAGVAINGVSVTQDKTVTGLTNIDLNVEGFGTSKRAATEEQLQKVIEKAETAGAGWNLTTNGNNSAKVAPGATVDFAVDENLLVSNLDGDGKPSTNVKFKLNKELSGIESIKNGTGDNAASIILSSTDSSVKINKVTVDKDGKISGVANGDISATSTDAVNGSQLYKATEAAKSSVSAGSNIEVTPEEDKTDGHMDYNVKLSDNINVTSVTAGNTVIDNSGLNIKGQDIVNVSLTSDGLKIGGNTYVNKDGLNANGQKITNVAAGEKDTDAVNVSQLKGVAAEAAKHTTVSEDEKGNIKITPETKDGQTDYKVSLNEDIKITSVTLGSKGTVLNEDGLTVGGANGSVLGSSSLTIGGVNGLALTSSSLSIGGRTYITGNGLNANDQKITNVADGLIDTGSKDAINGGQLKSYVEGYVSSNDKDTHIDSSKIYEVDNDNKVNMDVVDKNGKLTGEQITIRDVAKASDVGDINNLHDDINKGNIVDSINELDDKVGDLNYSQVLDKRPIEDKDSTTTAIGKLNNKLSEVEQKAGQHTTVTAGSDNISLKEDVNSTGGKDYTIDISQNLNIESVTAGDTVLNKDGVKVGNDVSLSKDGLNAGGTTVTKDGLTVGDTKVTETGLQIGDKTYVSKDGLNANDQKVTNVADGEVSATSKDAVNGSQLHATNSRIDETNQQVMNNTQNISKLGSRLNKVGAGAAALAALHPMDFDPDDKLTFAAGVGNYGGENAAAIGAYYRPDEKVMFSVGGTMGNGENMVNAGISFALDRTNHVSNSRTAMAREIVDLRAEINELKAMLAKGGLGSIDEDKLKIFPDVAENHWAYEYVGKLAAAGIVEGFPNGEFDGDRMMSRYEFAAMLYRAMQKGAQLDSRIINEFAPEMGRIRVDRISGADNDKRKIERVRVNGTDKAKNDYRDHYGSKIAK